MPREGREVIQYGVHAVLTHATVCTF